MTKDKKTPQEITDADLDQVTGGAKSSGSTKGLTGDELGFPRSISPTPKNMERVHEDE